MSGPTPEEQRVPPYVALVRIGAVVGMSIFAALGIFLILLASRPAIISALICFALVIPFFFVMRLAEGSAESDGGDADTEAT